MKPRKPSSHPWLSSHWRPLHRGVSLIGSARLTIILLGFLLTLIVAGTVAQASIGLFASRRIFFSSWFVVRDLDWVTLPLLPGGRLLLTALAINLAVGGIGSLGRRSLRRRTAQTRRSRLRNAGVLTVHAAILGLLAAVWQDDPGTDHSVIRLRGGGPAQGTSLRPNRWQLQVRVAGMEPTALPDRQLRAAATGASTSLPGDWRLRIDHFSDHATRDPNHPNERLIDLEPAEDWRRNHAACVVSLLDAQGGRCSGGLLTALDRSPLQLATADGRPVELQLARARRPLPFELSLDALEATLHPGTDTAASVRAVLRAQAAGTESALHALRPNAPLRRDGLTIYLSTWQTRDAARLRPAEVELHVIVDGRSGQLLLLATLVLALGLVMLALGTERRVPSPRQAAPAGRSDVR